MRSNQAPAAGPYWLEPVSRSQTERRILVPYHTHILRLFHIHVMRAFEVNTFSGWVCLYNP